MKHEEDSETYCNWEAWNGLQMIGKELEQLKIGGGMDTIQMKALLRSARILCRVLEILGDFFSLRLHCKTLRLRWCEKLARDKTTILMRILIIRRKMPREVYMVSDETVNRLISKWSKNSKKECSISEIEHLYLERGRDYHHAPLTVLF